MIKKIELLEQFGFSEHFMHLNLQRCHHHQSVGASLRSSLTHEDCMLTKFSRMRFTCFEVDPQLPSVSPMPHFLQSGHCPGLALFDPKTRKAMHSSCPSLNASCPKNHPKLGNGINAGVSTMVSSSPKLVASGFEVLFARPMAGAQDSHLVSQRT